MATNITRQLAGTFLAFKRHDFLSVLSFSSSSSSFPFCFSSFFVDFCDYMMLLFVNFPVKNVTVELQCFDTWISMDSFAAYNRIYSRRRKNFVFFFVFRFWLIFETVTVKKFGPFFERAQNDSNSVTFLNKDRWSSYVLNPK